jgi:hypothetical protein
LEEGMQCLEILIRHVDEAAISYTRVLNEWERVRGAVLRGMMKERELGRGLSVTRGLWGKHDLTNLLWNMMNSYNVVFHDKQQCRSLLEPYGRRCCIVCEHRSSRRETRGQACGGRSDR